MPAFPEALDKRQNCVERESGFAVPTVVAFGIVFYAATWWGGFGGMAGAIVAVVGALLLPRLAPSILVFIALVQDAPGLSGNMWYASFVAVVAIMWIRYGSSLATRLALTGHVLTSLGRRHAAVVALFAVAVAYALAVTLILHSTGQYPYSPRRPPWTTAGLIVTVLLSGWMAATLVVEDPNGMRRLNAAIDVSLANVCVVLILQVAIGVQIYRSTLGLPVILGAAQLVDRGPLGIPRLTGTYLTPDGFAFAVLILLALKIAIQLKQEGRISSKLLGSFVIGGLAICALTLSKNAIILLILSIGLVAIYDIDARRRTRAVVTGILTASAAVAWILIEAAQTLETLRIPTAATYASTYRYIAWHAAITQFSLRDWILGTGLSYWPVMLSQYAEGDIASPHTWILSVPGTFGLVGVVAYAALGWHLFKCMRGMPGGRALSGTVAVMVYVVGAFSIDLAFGHTPLSYILWLSAGIAAALSRRAGQQI